jgi:hypothetical protein
LFYAWENLTLSPWKKQKYHTYIRTLRLSYIYKLFYVALYLGKTYVLMSPWGVVQLNILFSFFNDKRIYEKSFFFKERNLYIGWKWMELLDA